MKKIAIPFLSLIFVLVSSFSTQLNSSLIEKTSPFTQTYTISNYPNSFSDFTKSIYDSLKLGKSGLCFDVFEKALTGFYVLKSQALIKQKIITVVDFDIPSKLKRMWIINLDEKKLLFHTLVAHGKNSGADLAVQFSNKDQSYMSSLGFYVTGNTYIGKHGLSLVLKGMDKDQNTNAERRSIVLHGAEYVCEQFIEANGRLGRSQGCPAVPVELHQAIINNIKDGSLLYIHKSDQSYHSEFLDKKRAEQAFSREENFSFNTQNSIYSYK